MNKTDILNETKRNVMLYIENRDLLPNEQKSIIKEGFDMLASYYKANGCYNDTMQEYMEGKSIELFEYIKNINKERNNKQGTRILNLFKKMEYDLEETSINEKEFENFDLMSDNRNYALRFLDILKESLKNVQYRQNLILDNRKNPATKIEKLKEGALQIISSYVNKKEEKIYSILNMDDRKIADIVIRECRKMKVEMDLNENGRDSSESTFRESLNVTESLSYETQKKNSETFVGKGQGEDKEMNEKSLPDNLLE